MQHDDLHGSNVLTDAGRLRVIDWGDAVWAHPFGTLLVTQRSLAARRQVDPDDPLLRRVADAYLEPWRSRSESAAALAAEVDLVLRTAPLTRVAGWIRAPGTPGPDISLTMPKHRPSGWCGWPRSWPARIG